MSGLKLFVSLLFPWQSFHSTANTGAAAAPPLQPEPVSGRGNLSDTAGTRGGKGLRRSPSLGNTCTAAPAVGLPPCSAAYPSRRAGPALAGARLPGCLCPASAPRREEPALRAAAARSCPRQPFHSPPAVPCCTRANSSAWPRPGSLTGSHGLGLPHSTGGSGSCTPRSSAGPSQRHPTQPHAQSLPRCTPGASPRAPRRSRPRDSGDASKAV